MDPLSIEIKRPAGQIYGFRKLKIEGQKALVGLRLVIIFLFSLYFQYVLNPTFTSKLISTLDSSAKLSRAYDGTTYLPGIVDNHEVIQLYRIIHVSLRSANRV